MNVLVCEDDIVVLKVIQVALEDEHAQVTCVSDGRKALEQLRQNSYDLIITDIHMPHNNGDEILKLVREDQKKNTPFIMISSDTEEEVIVMALKLGVNEFISKPIDMKVLKKKLKKYLSA